MISFVTAISDSWFYDKYWKKFINNNPYYEFIKLSGFDSIFEAYNKGLQKASNELVCFAHQDCKIMSPKFFSYISNMFRTYPKLGAVFMVGSPVSGPDSWSWGGLDIGAGSFYDQKQNNLRRLSLQGDRRILVGDGYCFVTKVKDVVFESDFGGFHFYDILYSRALVDKGYHLMVPGVPLTFHRSPGARGSALWKELKPKLNKKINKILALSGDRVVECKNRDDARRKFLVGKR